VSRETENALLLLVGLSTAMIAVTGTYTRYVKPSLLPWLGIAAILLIALALNAIITNIRRPTPHNGDHGHAHRSRVGWLLTVPVVVMIFIVPPALAAQGVAPSVVAVSADVLRHPFPRLPAERAPEVSLKEVQQRAATDTAGTLNGRLITVTGFTMTTTTSGRLDLARVVITCCAADAQLARVHLAGSTATTAGNFSDNTWLRVEGQIVPEPRNPAATSVPTLAVASLTRIDPPANPYGY
jgi:uncharacterized repeat protein (TIGR03943 family)